jgi:Mg/Co/Ni transporter MgtE
LERLHPADLAEIASDLPASEGIELLTVLDDAVAADTLEEMEPDDQVRFLQALGPERAARVLERMSPDDAADLVQDLDRRDADMLLAQMDEQEAADIRRLLVYEEESAGGLMTTEYLAFEPEQTAVEVGERLREHTTEEEHAYHLFVTDPAGKLVGQVSLWELVTADPGATIGSFMDDDPVSVKVDEGKDEVVEAIMKYNLLAVPVVDDEDLIVGVITIDDVIDLVGPRGGRLSTRRFLR